MRVLVDYRIIKQHPELPLTVPDSLFDEAWAWKIHGQTLQRLNERGGLSPEEMIMNIEKLNAQEFYNQLKSKELTEEIAIKKLLEYLNK